MLRLIFFLILVFIHELLVAQAKMDTIVDLEEITIQINPSGKPLFRTPSSISIIDETLIKEQPLNSLVSTFNTVPGVRMEERSPGSYRLSIRGSLLRSPFGIRNIKIYLDEFPLTDAGGNTYLNSLDPGFVKRVEILKGPDGSIYGANTGGVIILNPFNKSIDTNILTLGISSGSYGLIQQKLNWQKTIGRYSFNCYQGFQKSMGFRDHSAMSRHFLQTKHHWQYAKQRQLRLFAMYSDLQYETPGGLTLTQFRENPRMARPAGSLPGAEEQKAGVFNRHIYLGLIHETALKKRLRHLISIFGSPTNFRNPFITNYEVRNEKNFGIRTYLHWSSSASSKLHWNWYNGLEWQKTSTAIDNFGNRMGNKDTIQASDNLKAIQRFLFTRFTIDLSKRWLMEAALSINFYNYRYIIRYPSYDRFWKEKKFLPQYMPKVSFSYVVSDNVTARASVSRGFSPPTIAEIRPSDNIINANLQAETGFNYETGVRLRSNNGRFWADGALFYSNLRNTIVRRVKDNGTEYFINAGKTSQPGIELQFMGQLLKEEKTILKKVEFRTSATYYRFSFHNYRNAGNDFSGNRLTGVPELTIVSSLTIGIKKFRVTLQHNYTSDIPLNDENNVRAEKYHLLQARGNYNVLINRNIMLDLFIASDNILNEKYSLGNDLNASGGRYFNAAAGRNYTGGLSLGF